MTWFTALEILQRAEPFGNQITVVWARERGFQQGKGPAGPGLDRKRSYVLRVRKRRVVPLSDDLPRILGQLPRLREKIERLEHFGIGFRFNLQAFFLAVGVHEEFALQVGADPIIVLDEVSFGVRHLVSIERLAEILQKIVIHFEVLGDLVADSVVLGEVEERVMLQAACPGSECS